MPLLFKITQFQKSHIYWSDAIKLSPPSETQIYTDKNRVIEQKTQTHTHTPYTERKITLERVSVKLSDTLPFLEPPSAIFYLPLLFLLEKSEPSHFGENFENPPHPIYKGRRV